MNPVVGALVIAGATALAVGVLLLVRRRTPPGGHFEDTTPASGVFTILATFFAVLFAFVVLYAFSAYNESSNAAELEAETTLQQFETADLFHHPLSPTLAAELRCYARSVVNQEWPAMQQDQTIDLNHWDTELFKTIRQIDPATAAEQEEYAQWLDQRVTREEARERRTLGEEGVIPTPVWLALVVTGLIVWGFVFLFADQGERTFTQVVLVASVTAMLTTGLLLVWFLDNPYRAGPGSLQPTAMQTRLVQMDELARDLQVDLPDLCDAEGRAR